MIAAFDHAVLAFWHGVAEWGSGFFTPVFSAVTFVGEKGIAMFALALLLICFARTRKLGVCMFGAVCCGALLTNFILKDLVARPRPFLTDAEFADWWTYVGAPAEDGFSFPSGHVTAAMAGMTALLICTKKKRALFGMGYVVLMACSRNYLMAHYPTDVLAAVAVGATSAFAAWGITIFIYGILHRYEDVPLVRWILHFDIRHPKAWKTQ